MGRRANWLKHPKTTQEKRMNQETFDSVYGIFKIVRAKRNPRNLPDAWDDIRKTDASNRNWKRYRKTQWKNT